MIEMRKICRTCGEALRYVNADGFEYYSHEGAPRGHHATPMLPREAAHEEALIENARRAAAVPVSEYMIQARAIIRDSGCADRPHAYALGFAAQTLSAAASGRPINRKRALLAYAVYLAAADRSPADDVMPTAQTHDFLPKYGGATCGKLVERPNGKTDLCEEPINSPVHDPRAYLRYERELSGELDKFAAGHPPYPYTHQHATASGYAELTDPHVD